MKRALALALLLACAGAQGCATSIIGGGGSKPACTQPNPSDCPKQESK